ncbi:LPXTG cell wall anchor domain-containing protein, partial [Aerococcus christensenii]|uniref:LPXTG cell wall anchor domain-containing protein n=1 Tax=Aerococcus christensenii TaxID=87541 RepID=UPI00254E9C90
LQKAEEASKAQAKDITSLKANLSQSAEAAQKAKETLKQLADQDKELKDALKSLQETVKKNKADQDNQMKRIEADMTHPSSQSQGDKGSVQVDQTGQVSVTKPTDHQKENTTEKNQSTQKTEKKSGEKKEGKDKSLDRSNEGKGKSLPKTGLTSMGAVIGGLGTWMSSIGGFFFYKNKKKG